MPDFSFESAFPILIPRVSARFPEVTQQIHSFRASGVMSSHTESAAGADLRAFLKSEGSVCTPPPGIPFSAIELILPMPVVD